MGFFCGKLPRFLHYTAAKRTKHIIAETCENVLFFLKDSVIMVSNN